METTIDQADVTPSSTTPTDARGASSPSRWAGRVMTGLPALFLAWDGLMKVICIQPVVLASEKVGFHRSTLPFIGAIELLAILLLSIRRTRPFGAVLVTAYLGGAVATHVRLGDPLFSHILAPVYVAALLWGGLCLRDPRVRALSPFKS